MDLPNKVATFGVFRSVDVAAVEMTHRAGLRWVQGMPTSDGLAAASTPVSGMLALQDSPELMANLADYSGPLLVDGPKSGSGQVADQPAWLRCPAASFDAGGWASAESVAYTIQRPTVGVDVSSGVESQPGVKDPLRIQHFVRAALVALESINSQVGEAI